MVSVKNTQFSMSLELVHCIAPIFAANQQHTEEGGGVGQHKKQAFALVHESVTNYDVFMVSYLGFDNELTKEHNIP